MPEGKVLFLFIIYDMYFFNYPKWSFNLVIKMINKKKKKKKISIVTLQKLQVMAYFLRNFTALGVASLDKSCLFYFCHLKIFF